jgi:hypothetical protein
MTTIGDTFTGVDGTTLSDHTATGPMGGFTWDAYFNGSGLTINGNALRSTGTGLHTEVRADSIIGPDQRVQVQITSAVEGSNRADFGVVARKDATTTHTCYAAWVEFNAGVDTVYLRKYIDDVATDLDTASVTWADGDILKLEVLGTSLKVYQNSTELISETDSSITTGDYAGIFRDANSNTPVVVGDNWQAEAITESSGGSGAEGSPMSVIQIHEETENDSSITFAFPNTPTTGNLVVLVVTSGSAATFTATGFTTDKAETEAGSRCSIFSKTQTTGNSFTVTRSTGTGDWRVVGFEIPPASADVSASDTDASGSDTVDDLTVGPTSTPTFANAIAIAGVRFSGNTQNLTVDNGFAKAFSDNPRQEAAYKILSVVSAVTLTWDWDNGIDHAASCLVVYGNSGAGGGGGGGRVLLGGSLTII